MNMLYIILNYQKLQLHLNIFTIKRAVKTSWWLVTGDFDSLYLWCKCLLKTWLADYTALQVLFTNLYRSCCIPSQDSSLLFKKIMKALHVLCTIILSQVFVREYKFQDYVHVGYPVFGETLYGKLISAGN